MMPFIAILWAGIITTLLVRAATQYRHYQTLTPRTLLAEQSLPTISIIIPARNEASNIGRCLRSLLSQHYPGDRLRFIVVNDASTDATPLIVRQLAGEDPRVLLLEAGPLPPGWAGKPRACWAGSLAAAESEWLCFLDADTVAEPALLATAADEAVRRELDMLSLEPRQVMGSFWERLVLPAGFFLLAFQQDLRRVNNPEAADASANGQFILIRHNVYDRVGGHAAVRSEICEDSALARAVKRAGGKLALLGAEKLIRTRMYTGWMTLWEGLSKNVTEMIGGLTVTVLVAAAALALAWTSVVAPYWACHAVAIQPHAAVPIAACVVICLASLALLCTHISGAFYFGIPWWYGFLFPIGYTAGAFIALNSVRLRMKGRVAWKGRVYQPTVGPQELRAPSRFVSTGSK
jgi:chlorobactene glucosyltransferase